MRVCSWPAEMPQLDPVALSFWCAKNVLLRDRRRWDVFETNSVTKRMLIISQSLSYVCVAIVIH